VTCKGGFNMHQMSANFVPWLLTDEKQWQILASKNMAVVPTFLTCWRWSLLIPSCFWEWNYSYENVISRIPLKFRNNHWLSYIWFWNSSPSISRNAGRVTLTQKWTTSQRIATTNNRANHVFHYELSLGTLWCALMFSWLYYWKFWSQLCGPRSLGSVMYK
jgi:hypothetical protein